MMPLSERLKEWQDFDYAQYHLGVVLGLFQDMKPEDRIAFDRVPKWLLWTNNPLSNTLGNILNQMLEIGVLECDDDQSFRWNTQQVDQWRTSEWKTL
jgi:hypothetical protein